MRSLLLVLLLGAVMVGRPTSGAESWGLANEKLLEVEGKVVDLLCALTGDCPADCGGGKRQLGLVTSAGRLLPAAKSRIEFAGAVHDLAPLCGRTVQADGLLVEHPAMPLYFVQGLRTKADEAYAPTEAFIAEWTRRNSKAEEWWRADPLAKAVIASDGVYGVPGLAPMK